MLTKLKIYLFILLFALSVTTYAKVTLPNIFSDNMVLQRNTKIFVWGWADPNESVTVNFHKQTVSVIADKNGSWSVKLRPEKAGKDFELTVSGENTINIKNVAIGEVWLCSGQSNMEWTVGQSMNAAKEIADSETPDIRHIKIERAVSGNPQTDFRQGVWKVSNPTNSKDFTAVGYFFAKELFRELKVPIGIINATWGGTNIETWISREGFESSREFSEMISKLPKVDFDKLLQQKQANQTKRIEQLQGVKLNSVDFEAFNSINFDDSILPMMNVPELWESQRLGEIDGVVWLRKTFVLSKNQSSKSAILNLAKIDDWDETFLNGVKIGETKQWNAPRKYSIRPDVLNEGKNVIVVKVTDTGGGGGIYGNPDDFYLKLGDETYNIGGNWRFQVESLSSRTTENEFPSLCYNAMINPLIPYAFRGVLWYQGESNVGRAFQYRTSFPLLINDWRTKWKSEFPFYFVQLATFKTTGNSNEGSSWAELREAQSKTLKLPKTGMAVTTDIGNPNDIHPTNKQDVGKRLAVMALQDIFKKNSVSRSPAYKSMKVVGNQAIITFENIGGGLMTTDSKGRLFGFEVADDNQVFYSANAVIKENKVVVSSARVASPTAVRFGWIGDASACNLFNKEGFPVIPFRTDDWKTITKEVKYKIAGF